MAVRWTIGEVTPEGFEALRLSIWGAWKLFGTKAEYLVCTNRITAEAARARVGDVPPSVQWRNTMAEFPSFLKPHFDPLMAEGVAWKFAPLRAFPNCDELSLDNDCILWKVPQAVQSWLEQPAARQRCLLAEDVCPGFGQFSWVCGSQGRNSGIRGLPVGFNYEKQLSKVLARNPVLLRSELDEQGLQTAALSLGEEPWTVGVKEVSICSPFPPHLRELGRCGAHFCGLNARDIPWELEGRPAREHIQEHWDHHRMALYEKVGIKPAPRRADRPISRAQQ